MEKKNLELQTNLRPFFVSFHFLRSIFFKKSLREKNKLNLKKAPQTPPQDLVGFFGEPIGGVGGTRMWGGKGGFPREKQKKEGGKKNSGGFCEKAPRGVGVLKFLWWGARFGGAIFLLKKNGGKKKKKTRFFLK